MVFCVCLWKIGNNCVNVGWWIVIVFCNILENVVEILLGYLGNGLYRVEEWGLVFVLDFLGEFFGI